MKLNKIIQLHFIAQPASRADLRKNIGIKINVWNAKSTGLTLKSLI